MTLLVSGKMTSLLDLPEEMMEFVMSFLPVADRKTARLVCRYLRDISYSAKIIEKEVVKVSSYHDLNHLNQDRKYFHIKIEAEEAEEQVTAIDFWSRSGEYVKSLDLQSVGFHHMSEVFLNTPNLEELELSSWETPRLIVPFPFQKLLRLSLQVLKLRGEEFVVLVENAPRLEELTLIFDNQTVEPDLIDSLEAFTYSRRNFLKLLHFFSGRLEDFQLTKILSNIGPRMLDLSLFDIIGLTDACLPIIKEKMPNLRKITLRNLQFTDEGLHNLLRELKLLTHIDLTMSLVEERTASLFPTMSHLRSVDLSDTPLFDQRCLRLAFGTHRLLQLTELTLKCYGDPYESLAVTDEILAEILAFLPNLKSFYLKNFEELSDLAVQHIANFSMNLRVLSLSGCYGIKDVSAINTLPHLEYLCLRGCEIWICSYLKLRLMKLKEIIVKEYNHAVMQSLGDNCPCLQDVYLDAKDRGEHRGRSHPFRIHYWAPFSEPCWEKYKE